MQKSLLLLLYLEYFYQEHECIGRESYHIGASGLIHVLFSFIFKGIKTKTEDLRS
jgi:hypothetical protein